MKTEDIQHHLRIRDFLERVMISREEVSTNEIISLFLPLIDNPIAFDDISKYFWLMWFPYNIQTRITESFSIFHSKEKDTYILQLVNNQIIHTMRFYTDPIANTYQLSEMSRYQRHEDNKLNNSKESRRITYETSKNDPVLFKYRNTPDQHEVMVHKFAGDDTQYTTLDHTSKEAIHKAYFVKHASGSRFDIPFDHETQDSVERIRHPALTKGYATDMTMMHFEKSDLPLSTSDTQQLGGHNMWERMAYIAYDNGYKVYLWNNLNKTLTKLDSKEKINDGLNHYFGIEPRTIDHGHIIISKKELT